MEMKSGESLTLYFMNFRCNKMKKQILKFFDTQSVYRCPICTSSMGTEMKMQDNASSLVCTNNHCFDISSKGYVNFLQNSRQSKVYNLNFFESRRKFIDDGFYSHISDEVCSVVSKIEKSEKLRIADAGCGEGSFSLSLSQKLSETAEIFAFDFSKDAVQIASKGGNNILWMVSDIANIPLASNSMDVILNIYSPANYAEFKRILKKGGILAKVIPGANHMCELRNKIHTSEAEPESEEYSNQQVVDVFERNFEISDRYIVTKTYPISESQIKNLLGMTPLMFGVDEKSQNIANIDKITVEAEILISNAI